MKTCTSCNKQVSNDYIEFSCPSCSKELIVRCFDCREKSTPYKCIKCSFEGP